MKRSLEESESRTPSAEKRVDLNIYFNGKGMLADSSPFSCVLIFFFNFRYKLCESSWEPEESMFDPSFMIEKFRGDALEEGIDIDKEETRLTLLQVAKDPSVPQPNL